MKVPFLDLVVQYEMLREEILSALETVMRHGQFILGEEVEAFEERFAAFCGAEHCVGVSSGTEALHLALRALDIGPGDEVIVPANTFAATAFAISYVGASPVFVDANDADYNIDVKLIEKAITDRTKGIMPVHLYGQAADMDEVVEIARRYGLKVIEDACQAHGAEYKGRRVGAIGHAGCFSFYPGKNLGGYGDGGAVVTNDREIADKVRLLRNYAQRTKNIHTGVGFNSRLDTVQAAILLVKLRHLQDWNEKRRTIAQQYGDLLLGCDVVLPKERLGLRHVYHLYVIQHDRRDALITHMKREGISCGVHYPMPLNGQIPYSHAKTFPEGVPVSTRLSKRIISLPMFPEMTETQIRRVVEGIASFQEIEVGETISLGR